MNNSRFSTLRIISSLPGRVRVNILGLLRNEKMMFNIRKELGKCASILSFYVSKYSGNVLIYYNNSNINEDKILFLIEKALVYDEKIAFVKNTHRQSLLRIFIHAISPIFLFKRKHLKKIYKNEYSISNKILKVSISISGVILLFTGNISAAISVLILGYPGILFVVPASSYYYVSTELKMKNIYLKNNTSLNLFNNFDTLLIDNDIFQNRFDNNILNSNLNKYDIQKLIILGKLDNPISSDIELIIHNIRILGITSIFIIGDNKSGITRYISHSLGIRILDINNFEKMSNYPELNKTKNSIILITTDTSFESQSVHSYSDLVICLYKNANLSTLKSDINLEYSNMDKLPLLIELSHFCKEVNSQMENIAISINVLGILLAALSYLTLLCSIIFYISNALLMALILKLKFHKNFNKISAIKLNQLIE